MKLLKIFGIVAGIHVVALILIFANPGCSTTSKPAPTTSATVIDNDSPTVSVPLGSGSAPATDSASTDFNAGGSPVTPAPIAFNPDAPAVGDTSGRYSPTRPGTPVASALQAEPVADVTPASTYTVARGDSLWSIAKHNHLSVAELSSANNLRASSTLQIGQKLLIPGKAPAPKPAATMATSSALKEPAASTPAPAAPAKSGESVKHTVKAGETLGGIARKYQVSVGEIATANNITDPAKIRPGQELVIPGWKAPKTTAKTAPAPTAAPTATPNEPLNNPPQIITDGNPLFVPPPADKPLDEGLKNNAGDAPVIQVEDASNSH